jgi:hypothetical protein
MTASASMLVACACGFVAEGRLRVTGEGARFWVGRCIGCERTLIAPARGWITETAAPIWRGAASSARLPPGELAFAPASTGAFEAREGVCVVSSPPDAAVRPSGAAASLFGADA